MEETITVYDPYYKASSTVAKLQSNKSPFELPARITITHPQTQFAQAPYLLMADHRVPSQQPNHISANTNRHPAHHQAEPHGHVQRVAFLSVRLIIVVYLCVSFFRTLMWPVITSKTSIGRASLSEWLYKVKCSIHATSTNTITTIRHRHTITFPHYL